MQTMTDKTTAKTSHGRHGGLADHWRAPSRPALKNEGMDVIFTLIDGEIVDVYVGCLAEGIRIIDVAQAGVEP